MCQVTWGLNVLLCCQTTTMFSSSSSSLASFVAVELLLTDGNVGGGEIDKQHDVPDEVLDAHAHG